jgi:hypothetical protein
MSVLVDLSYVQGPVHGPMVAAQLMDLAVRAEGVREFAVRCMLGLLLEPNLYLGQSQTTMQNVLYAAGWIIGEYADLLPKHATEVGAGPGLLVLMQRRHQWKTITMSDNQERLTVSDVIVCPPCGSGSRRRGRLR